MVCTSSVAAPSRPTEKAPNRTTTREGNDARRSPVLTRLPGALWSVILAAAAIARATSYTFRPPPMTVTTDLVESVIAYDQWAMILTTSAALIALGVTGARRHPVAVWATLLGHLLLVAAYTIFTMSILVAAVAYDGSWTSGGALFVVALLHAERVLTLASGLGRRH